MAPKGFIQPDADNATEVANLVATQLVEIINVRRQLGLYLIDDRPLQGSDVHSST